MTLFPPAPALALAGMGFVTLFAVWKAAATTWVPRLRRARGDPAHRV